MTDKVIAGLMILVGVGNFLPVLGVVSAARIAQAYGVEVGGADLEILLRHRALLFGIVGGFVLYAAFVPALQPAAMVMAGISMLGFVCLMWAVGGYNENLYRVLIVDLVGIVALLAAAVLRLASDQNRALCRGSQCSTPRA